MSQHVCPRCRESFEAPPLLADTFCPLCFGAAYNLPLTIPAGPWQLPLWGGIICLMGAVAIAGWVVLG